MKKTVHLFIVAAVALALLLPCGCKIISGTYVIEETFYNLTANGGAEYYYEAFDITGNSVWEDHKDDIKDIDNVGFEIWLDRHLINWSAPFPFVNCYLAPHSSSLDGTSSNSAVQSGATNVLMDVPMPIDKSFIGYAESFNYIVNLSTMKTLAESGQFKFWAMSDMSIGGFTIDSIRVVITITAGT